MKTNVKKNFALTLIYNLLNILIPLISTPYVARVLGAEKIGIYSYSYSVAYYFVIFAMLGLKNYGNRTIAGVRDNREKLSKTFWDIYYMQLILSLVAIIIYTIYFLNFADDKIIASLLTFYVMSAAFDITWFFFGVEDFQFAVLRNLVVKVLELVCILLLVKQTTDLWLYTLIMSVGFLSSQVFLWTKTKKYVDFKRFVFRDSYKHLKPNLILFIPVVAISIYNMMDKIMLGNICGKIQVGYYDNAEKIINVPQVIITALGTAMLPRISNMMANGEDKGAISYLRKSMFFSAAISSACTFGIIAVAPEFVPVFLGKGYDECIILSYYLMPMLIFKAFANVMRTQYLIPRKKDRVFVNSVCFGAIINFTLNLLFIPKMQAAGACIATIFAEATVCIYQMYYVMREQKLGSNVVMSLVFQLIGAIMFIALRLTRFTGSNWIVLIEKITIGGLLFISLSVIYCLWLKKRISL